MFLSGGSAYGLDVAGGIMKYLEERKIGLKVGNELVPIVVGSCLFDLACANGKVRPDEKMGYEVLKLLKDINVEFETTIALVSQDISVIKALCKIGRASCM